MRSFAFTLVELMVAVTIVAVLAALLLPLVASAGDRSDRIETQALFDTLAGGIERFKDETGHYPLPTGNSSEPFPGNSIESWYPAADEGWERQQLWWRLSVAPTAEWRIQGKAATQAHWETVDPLAGNPAWQVYWTVRSFEMRNEAEIAPLDAALDAAVSNEDAEEYRGPSCSDEDWVDSSGSPNFGERIPKYQGLAKIELAKGRGQRARSDALRSWTTAGILGYADVAERYRDDQQIIDAWGNPIGYIHNAAPAIEGRKFGASNGVTMVTYVHQPARLRATLTDRDGDGTVSEDDLLLPPAVDEQVDHNGDGTVDENDWGTWLYVALPGFEGGYQLVSAATDHMHHRLHSDDANRDDLIYRGGGE